MIPITPIITRYAIGTNGRSFGPRRRPTDWKTAKINEALTQDVYLAILGLLVVVRARTPLIPGEDKGGKYEAAVGHLQLVLGLCRGDLLRINRENPASFFIAILNLLTPVGLMSPGRGEFAFPRFCLGLSQRNEILFSKMHFAGQHQNRQSVTITTLRWISTFADPTRGALYTTW